MCGDFRHITKSIFFEVFMGQRHAGLQQRTYVRATGVVGFSCNGFFLRDVVAWSVARRCGRLPWRGKLLVFRKRNKATIWNRVRAPAQEVE